MLLVSTALAFATSPCPVEQPQPFLASNWTVDAAALTTPASIFQDAEEQADFSYTFIEVGYYSTDVDVIDESSDAVYGRASLGLFKLFYVFLDYTAESLDDVTSGAATGDVDNDQFGLGAGAHFSLMPKLDLVGEAAWLTNDVSSDDLANLDDQNDGWTGFVGARWMALPWEGGGLELNGGYRYTDIPGLLSDTVTNAWEVGARLHFMRLFSASLNYSIIEEDSRYGIGLRASF